MSFEIQSGGRTWRGVDVGSGPVVLAVHGFPLDHSMWREQWAGLRGFRWIAPDLPGFGGTSGPVDDVLTMAHLADGLAGLLEDLGVTAPVTYCGLSMGGYVGWEFWRRHPQRVRRLIQCDTRAAADSPAVQEQRQAAAAEVLEKGVESLAAGMIEKLFSAASRESRSDAVAQVHEVMRNTAPRTVAAALRGMAVRAELTGVVPQLDLPVLCVCGEEDAITPLEEMTALAESIPQATLAAIPGAGHMAPLEQPAAVNAALERFLEGESA